MDLFGLRSGKYHGSTIKKWMIIGLLGQIFEPVEIEIFLKCCGPILGSKKIYLGSKIDNFIPIWPKKWKISWKNSRKMDDTRSPVPIFEPIKIEIFLKYCGPILGLKNSASADGGPRSRVRARGTLCSAPHRH